MRYNRLIGVSGFALSLALAPLSAQAADIIETLKNSGRFSQLVDAIDKAGLTETHVSFTKGCYPGQEPIARLHYRGHANRGLRVLELDGAEPPGSDAAIDLGGKAVGRVTSAVREGDHVLALGYVRREVDDGADLRVEGRAARLVG